MNRAPVGLLLTGCGSLNLLATGEVCAGDTIHDRRQPHDLFMELSAECDRSLRGRWPASPASLLWDRQDTFTELPRVPIRPDRCRIIGSTRRTSASSW